VADLLNTYKIPLAQISPLCAAPSGRPVCRNVAGDDVQGARLAVEHLLALGHRRIACLMGPRNLRSSFDRLAGYRGALEQAGLLFDSELVRTARTPLTAATRPPACWLSLATRRARSMPPTMKPPSGRCLPRAKLGLDVPGRLSICGHDDLATATYIWPGLTTVHQPAEEMLERALRILIDLLKGGGAAQMETILPPRLIVRGSTGPLGI